MAWARLDDQFADHPKVRSLGVFGLALQTAAICYCARYLTDGFLSWSAADQLVASVMAPFTLPDGQIMTPALTSGMSGQDATEWDWKTHMIKAGLWEKTRRGYEVHDYLKYNPTRASVLKERASAAARMAKHRQNRNGVSYAVTSGEVQLPRPRTPKTKAVPKLDNRDDLAISRSNEPSQGDYTAVVERLNAKVKGDQP